MYRFLVVILVYVVLIHAHQFKGPHHGFHGAAKSAWGAATASSGPWPGSATATRHSASTPAVKGAWGPYPPPGDGPPSPQSSWGAGSPPRGSAPYPAPNYPPPRQGSGGTANSNPPKFAPYPSPASSQDYNRFGGNRGGAKSPGRKTVTTTNCRAGNKVYKVGEKWTPEGSCGRNYCLEGGKTSILGCPDLQASPNCTLSDADFRQPWPSCCPQLQCFR